MCAERPLGSRAAARGDRIHATASALVGGQRRLQDAFDSRRIADRLEEATYRSALSSGDVVLAEPRST